MNSYILCWLGTDIEIIEEMVCVQSFRGNIITIHILKIKKSVTMMILEKRFVGNYYILPGRLTSEITIFRRYKSAEYVCFHEFGNWPHEQSEYN